MADLDFTIAHLGDARIASPMCGVVFTGNDDRVLYHAKLADLKEGHKVKVTHENNKASAVEATSAKK